MPRFILARDSAVHGMSAKELARQAKAGLLHRVRRGVYVDRTVWMALKPWEQYRLQVSAAAETFESRTVFARQSAASVLGIPTVGNHPVCALTFRNDGGRSRAGVVRHFADPAGIVIRRVDGLLVTDRLRTVLDLAAYTPFVQAVVPVDHVLKPDRERGLPAISKEELLGTAEGRYTAAAMRRIRAVVAFADPLSGSAGESYSRALMHAAGFEPPILQQEFRDQRGLIGYTDFHWEKARIVGEFDGFAKYQREEYLNGMTPAEAVVKEKEREDRIRATGCGVSRWVWGDLMDFPRLEKKLLAAGVPRRAARSAR
ncbi:type IV toxin-antitoxin system AbiEi family antitoxin domain-containing protein [Arthrobacter sp. SW1]|uniref:type IV toxin-antitoxin system AbiEi family antitoxin domain-containing protein n=1 Tax=Arthrobacter sp. SW1 TaxID=1920889 RepID=UPI00209B2397|nr:type IV toxin-antitoxin system AbiEi family antitoxin domain-containing protein [Arthrobacter sp. SW1]